MVASEHLNALHQLIFVSAGDWDLVVVNFDDELEGVDVCDPVNVDDIVSADPHKVFEWQFQKQIFQK